jgi:hypothetical protein
MNARRVGIFVPRNEEMKLRAGGGGVPGDAVCIAQDRKTNEKLRAPKFGALKHGVSASASAS